MQWTWRCFAEAKEPFLRSFLAMANGLPSHDTFSQLFLNLNPDQLRDSFQRFMAQFSEQLQRGGGHRWHGAAPHL